MKKLTGILLILSSVMGACTSDSVKKETVAKVPQLFILVYDISKSNDSYAILQPGHFDKIYTYIGNTGGGKIYGLHIKSYSTKQEPFVVAISSLDTLQPKGNRIQSGHIKQKNKQLVQDFETGRDQFVTNAGAALIKDKSESFSDVKNALILVKQILNMPEYADWEKSVLIISDMENDLPPVDGMDKLSPVDFGVNVKIGVVRPSNRVQVNKIFTNLTATNCTTIDDGIKTLITLK